MKVAIPTNTGKVVAPHIALAKKFLIVDLESGEIKEVENPIMVALREEGREIPKEEPRGLGAGRILPPFFAELGVKALIAREINPRMEQNLWRYGIEGVETEIKNIEELINSLREGEIELGKGRGEGDRVAPRWRRWRMVGGEWQLADETGRPWGFGRGMGRGMGRGLGRGFGRRWEEEETAEELRSGRGIGRGLGRGMGRGVGRGMGRGMGVGRGFGRGRCWWEE